MKRRLILTGLLLMPVGAMLVSNWNLIWDSLTLADREITEPSGSRWVGRMRRWSSDESRAFVGVSRHYDSSGTLSYVREERGGDPHGLQRYWSSDGVLHLEETYERGELRTSRRWSSSGVLLDAMRWNARGAHSGITDGSDDGERYQSHLVHGEFVEQRDSPPWFTEAEIEAALTCPDPSHGPSE